MTALRKYRSFIVGSANASYPILCCRSRSGRVREESARSRPSKTAAPQSRPVQYRPDTTLNPPTLGFGPRHFGGGSVRSLWASGALMTAALRAAETIGHPLGSASFLNRLAALTGCDPRLEEMAGHR